MAGDKLCLMVQTAFVVLLLLAPLMQSVTTPIRTGLVARQLMTVSVKNGAILATKARPCRWLRNESRRR